MAKTWKEIDFSSFLCSCGHQLDFFENTIRELKRDSLRRPQILAEGPEDHEHRVVFRDGEVVDVLCSDRPKRAKKPANAGTAKKPPKPEKKAAKG